MTAPPPRRPPSRTLWSDLRALDAALVPRVTAVATAVRAAWLALGSRLEWIGAAVYAAGRLASRTVERARASRQTWFEGRPERPTVAARPRADSRGRPVQVLADLDARYARTGPLGLVRDVPQLGAVVIALVLTIAALTVTVRHGGGDSGDSGGSTGPDLPAVITRSSIVGPYVGQRAADYLFEARAALLRRATSDPNTPIFAIADFEKPVTPADAAAALPGVVPRAVFVHAFAPGNDCGSQGPRSVAEDGLPRGANEEFTLIAICLERAATQLKSFARTIQPTDTEQARQKAAGLRDAATYSRTAANLRSSCACVIAVVVRATPLSLLHIANSGAVTVIDPAEPGLPYSSICWVPLFGGKAVAEPCAQPGAQPSGP